MTATGSTQRYKRQLDQLEHSLTAKLQELSILEQENEILRAQERALSSYISSVEGGVAVTARMIKQQCGNAAAAAAATAAAAKEDSLPCGSTAAGISLHDGSVVLQGDGVSLLDGTVSLHDDGVSLRADAELLERIESKEREIQAVLRPLDAGSYEELYSTLLLRTAASNPEATAALLATPPRQRRQTWCSSVQQIALLLPKYDHPDLGRFNAAAAAGSSGAQGSSGSSCSSAGSTAQEVVNQLVDEVATGLLVTGLLDPPQMTLYNFMVNMSLNQVADSYPEGFWQHVAEGLLLTDKQRSALHISWKRIKSEKLLLTEQHEQVLARLNQLRAQQRQQSKQFEEDTHQVMLQPPDPHEDIVTRRQQQQILAKQQQQQQQQQGPKVQGLEFPGGGDDLSEMFDPRFDDLGEAEIQDLLQHMDHADHQQQWLLLDLDLDQQQQQLDLLLDDHQHQGLASSDVATLAVRALASDVVADLDRSPRTSESSGTFRQTQHQQQQTPTPTALSLPQQQQQQQTASPTAPSPPAPPPQQQQQEKEAIPRHTAERRLDPQPDFTALPGVAAPAAAGMAAVPKTQHQQQQQHGFPALDDQQQQRMPKQDLILPPNHHNHQQQQQQQQQGSSPLLNWQEIAVQLQEIQQHVGACTEQQEHFVPVGTKEQQQLERELNRIRGKIKMQHYCSALFWVNTLSKKQLAMLYVLSWPFMPDGFALSEQLEAEGTPSTSVTTTKSG